MLDQKFIRSQPEKIRESLKSRGYNPELVNQFLEDDKQWRDALQQSDTLKQQRNAASEEIGRLKKTGGDSQSQQEEVRKINERIKLLETDVKKLEQKANEKLLLFPNIPHSSVPHGKDASANVIAKDWKSERRAAQNALPHWDIAEKLQLADFARAAKLSGSMFALYVGLGARLQRALIQFMLDFHIKNHGYTEIYPPYLVREEIMIGTGQLPKFKEDMYACEADNLYLIPTAEVPVTNLHRDETLTLEEIPKNYVAYTACFRREAGAAGADTRGLQRLHQFDKVELVKITTPESSYDEHEKLLTDAEDILKALEIPYHVLLLCTGDMGFAAAKCYDLEAWCPGQKKWAEVSSCSNFEDFQGRRANIRFRREPQAKPEFVHTLNASGLALPRTMIALLENYQETDTSVTIPAALRPYMDGMTRLEAKSLSKFPLSS